MSAGVQAEARVPFAFPAVRVAGYLSARNRRLVIWPARLTLVVSRSTGAAPGVAEESDAVA